MNRDFEGELLYLFNQKIFYPYEYMSDFVYMNTFEEWLPHKDDFYSSLTGKKIIEEDNDCHDLYLKCDVLLLVVFY